VNRIFVLASILILISSQAWAQPSSDDHVKANVKCVRAVEKAALYDFKWIDAWYEIKFKFVTHDEEQNVDAYGTDKISFQNEYGAWRRYMCVCVWDAKYEQVLDIGCQKK
jgi:hypothetical protein